MAIINGTVFLLKIGGTALPDQTEGSISINMETRDITTKDSSGYRELLEGVRSGSISVSGLIDDDGAGGAGGVLFADLDSRTAQTIIFGLDDPDEVAGYLELYDYDMGVAFASAIADLADGEGE